MNYRAERRHFFNYQSSYPIGPVNLINNVFISSHLLLVLMGSIAPDSTRLVFKQPASHLTVIPICCSVDWKKLVCKNRVVSSHDGVPDASGHHHIVPLIVSVCLYVSPKVAISTFGPR